MPATSTRSMLSRRSFLVGVPVVAATLLLAACGGGGGGSGSSSGATAAIRTGPVTTTTVPATVKAEQAPVKVEGKPLPQLGDGADSAIGMAAPTVSGTSFAGTPLTIGTKGRAYLVVFVAHWCPHCQREVPKVGPWIAKGGLPDGVDAYAVATGTRKDYPNYPPSAWLRREKWPTQVLADSDDFAAAQAFGLSAYPFFVLVDKDGKVADRFSGEVELGELQAKVNKLVAA